MSILRFDSSQMLPLFQIISPNSRPTNVNLMEASVTTMDIIQKHKKRSKKMDVPVHRSHNSEPSDSILIHKNSEPNISSHKSKHHRRDKSSHRSEDRHCTDYNTEEITDNLKSKLGRKHLMKQNEKISAENQNLVEHLSSVQHMLDKKETQLSKLKEKMTAVQNFNKELLNENNIIKTQYQDMLVSLEEFKTQLRTKTKCTSCEELKLVMRKQNSDIVISKTANKELNEDLNMLKNVIYRLNVQLERYQEKLRKTNALTASNNTLNSSPMPAEIEIDMTDTQNNDIMSQNQQAETLLQHSDHLHTPVSWGNVNTHTLGPLMDAYQDTIKEKDEIIKSYEQELTSFTGKLKTILEENELLHRKSAEESELLKKNLVELESNRKELKVNKDQNDLLIKKCALKHDKLQEICKIYDHKIECMRRDYEVLQEEYHKSRTELNSLQGKYHSLMDVHESLKSDRQNVIPLTVHTTSVNECKRLFEELKTQYDHEKTKLLNQVKLLEQQTTELGTKVVDVGAENRDLLLRAKSMEKQAKKSEHKLLETKSALTHTQISRDTCKRQLAKAIEFGRELVTEQESLLHQLASRHKENKAVKQIGSNIVSRMDVLKSQLKTVQKDAYQQLVSVEQRIQEQDSSIESMRREHADEMEKVLKEMQDKDEYIARLLDQAGAVPATPYLMYREKHRHLAHS
ncbi:Centrosomal protein 89kDa [Carabus blaptoides fortunei]